MAYVATDQTAESKDYSGIHTHIDELYFEDALNRLPLLGSQRVNRRTIPAGSELFRAGDSCNAIYSLVDGWVTLYDLFEDGRRQILKFALPGALLAFSPMPGGVFNFSAQALTDVVIRTVPRDDFVDLCKDHAQLGLQLAWLISQDRDLAYDHLASVGRRSAHARVAHLLLELFVRCRLRWPGYRIEEMHLPLTQEDIGDATGLTGVHVNRVLRDLRKDGVVEFHYHKLRILNPDALFDVAGIDADASISWMRFGSRMERSEGAKSAAVVPFRPSVGAANERSRSRRSNGKSLDVRAQDIGGGP